MIPLKDPERVAQRSWRVLRPISLVATVAVVGLGIVATTGASSASSSKIVAVGAENEYANVISQIGGRYVAVSAVMSDPATDPHTYEASTQVAREVAGAQLVVQNGVGYDTFMGQIESASPTSSRKVIDVQKLLGLPASTKNPHLWYAPTTMPRVARAIEKSLAAIQPAHAAYFTARLATFDDSLASVNRAIAAFKARFHGDAVATTEPVADYLLSALGLVNKTPWRFQADIMNGIDPSPEDVAIQDGLFTHHRVKVFCYNAQVSSSVTVAVRRLAVTSKVPIVGVYETMPTPGYTYQSWMMAEIAAIARAITVGTSTTSL